MSCMGGIDDPTVVIVAGRLMRPSLSATTVNVSSTCPCPSTDPDAGSQSHAHRPRLWVSCGSTINLAGILEPFVIVTVRVYLCRMKHGPKSTVPVGSPRVGTLLCAASGILCRDLPTPGTSTSRVVVYLVSVSLTSSSSTFCFPNGKIVPADGTHVNSPLSSPGTRSENRMGISHPLCTVKSFVYRNP